MLKLYEYTDQYRELMDDLQDIDLTDRYIADTIEGLRGEIKLKGQNIGSFICNMDANVTLLKEHESKIKVKRLAMQKRIDWLKNYLLTNMQSAGINEISCSLFTIKPCKNPPSVLIDNEDQVPDKYKSEITTVRIDKKLIAIDLKDGHDISGVHSHQGFSLNIK